jgi:putative transposase
VSAKLMRFPRVKAESQGFYHCISRVVEGRYIFDSSAHGSVEAEHFIKLMRRLEAFSGIHILTYALMSNHFHLLCEVPAPKSLSDEEVLERVEAGFGQARRQALQEQFARYRQQSDGSRQIQVVLDGFRRRMYDISNFFKELKGGFTQRFNRRHDRYGFSGPNASRVFYWKAGRH